MHVFIVSQTAGPIWTKLGTGIVSGKSRSRSRSECRRRENRGAERDRGEDNAIGMSTEVPTVTVVGRLRSRSSTVSAVSDRDGVNAMDMSIT